MEDLTSLIRYLIGASRVKYEVLENLYATIPTMQYRMGVMYVDAHSIFYRLFREKDFSTVYADSMNELVRDLVVGFFNVIGHYRRFMATRLQLDNDIYVMFNPDLPKWHEHYTDKNGWCHDKYKRYDQKHPDYGFHAKAIRKAYSFIVGLSPYFEGIYCIDSTGIDEFALMAGMGFSDDTFYTIYSRNMYCTQFVRKNVVQLVNRRDNSRVITAGNCYSDGVLFDKKTEASDKLTPDMLPLIWTLGGCSDVGVKPSAVVSGLSPAIRIANKMAETGDLVPGMSIQSFLDVAGQYVKSKVAFQSERKTLERRYKVLSAHMAGAAITADQVAKVKAMCYDVFGETELEQLNEMLALGEVDPELLEIQNLNMSEAVQYDY